MSVTVKAALIISAATILAAVLVEVFKLYKPAEQTATTNNEKSIQTTNQVGDNISGDKVTILNNYTNTESEKTQSKELGDTKNIPKVKTNSVSVNEQINIETLGVVPSSETTTSESQSNSDEIKVVKGKGYYDTVD